MEKESTSEAQHVNLRVSVEELHRGLKNLDFFADHTAPVKKMQYTPENTVTMDSLYLRTALTTLRCPLCNQEAKRNMKGHLMEWFLKFAGRKIVYCTSCDWKEIVKENKWEWETIGTALAAFLIICFASIHWILR